MPSRIFSLCLFLAGCLVCTGLAYAQTPGSALFGSDEVLELTMPVDFDSLCRPSDDPDCAYTASEFRYVDRAGQTRSVPISIRRREGWRAQQTNCQVPTLFVRFSPQDALGTPFEGQTELALTSHCGKGYRPGNVPSRRLPDQFESYVINEYLAYRLYNLVTDASLRVRLASIRYVHPDKPRLDFTNDAFFSEHFDSLAARLDAELLPPGSFDLAHLDYRATDQMALFDYMIGNTDWSLREQENVLLLRTPNGKQVPVAFDFDMSGLVNAHYARPASGLPLSDVRQRYFMGFCHPYADWDALFEKFSSLRDPALALVAEMPRLGRGDRRIASVYLEAFFRTLDTPEARENNIVKACVTLPNS